MTDTNNTFISNYVEGIRNSTYKYKMPTMLITGVCFMVANSAVPDIIRVFAALLGVSGLLVLGLLRR